MLQSGFLSVLCGWTFMTVSPCFSDFAYLDASDPSLILEVLEEGGHDVLLRKSPADEVIIDLMTYDHQPTTLQFQSCYPDPGQNCQVLVFKRVWLSTDLNDALLDKIESWHLNSIWGSVYLEDNQKIVFQMALNMNHGVSKANFLDSVEIWMSHTELLKNYIEKAE